jgi:hypothetical protein
MIKLSDIRNKISKRRAEVQEINDLRRIVKVQEAKATIKRESQIKKDRAIIEKAKKLERDNNKIIQVMKKIKKSQKGKKKNNIFSDNNNNNTFYRSDTGNNRFWE